MATNILCPVTIYSAPTRAIIGVRRGWRTDHSRKVMVSMKSWSTQLIRWKWATSTKVENCRFLTPQRRHGRTERSVRRGAVSAVSGHAPTPSWLRSPSACSAPATAHGTAQKVTWPHHVTTPHSVQQHSTQKRKPCSGLCSQLILVVWSSLKSTSAER